MRGLGQRRGQTWPRQFSTGSNPLRYRGAIPVDTNRTRPVLLTTVINVGVELH